MKKGWKILGLLMITLSIFGLAMFWSAADENTGVSAVRISPLLIALAAVAGLAMCGGRTRQGAAVSLLPAAALGWVLALATDTPLWGNVPGTSWNCVTPLTLMLTLWFTAQGLWALPAAKDRRFDAKSCLLGCGMLLCSALPSASYAVRDGVYAAISTSAGTHRAATLFCMILIEIAFLAGGLSLLPFAEKKMDKSVATLLLAMGLIGVLLHEFALWGGGAARLGRLYAAVADPVTLSVFSALGCAGIRALVLDKRTKKA